MHVRFVAVLKGFVLRGQKPGVLLCRPHILETAAVQASLGSAVPFTSLEHSPLKEEGNEV